jgi:hypothetical protein
MNGRGSCGNHSWRWDLSDLSVECLTGIDLETPTLVAIVCLETQWGWVVRSWFCGFQHLGSCIASYRRKVFDIDMDSARYISKFPGSIKLQVCLWQFEAVEEWNCAFADNFRRRFGWLLRSRNCVRMHDRSVMQITVVWVMKWELLYLNTLKFLIPSWTRYCNLRDIFMFLM